MRALSVRQPWAWAIFHAGKDVENRTWKNQHTMGSIAIHASRRTDPLDLLPPRTRHPEPEDLVSGAIIGVVDVVGVVERHRSKWFAGPLGWVVRNPRAIRSPIHSSGHLGLWTLPPGVERRLLRQIRR